MTDNTAKGFIFHINIWLGTEIVIAKLYPQVSGQKLYHNLANN
jgi:hypothetical protein